MSADQMATRQEALPSTSRVVRVLREFFLTRPSSFAPYSASRPLITTPFLLLLLQQQQPVAWLGLAWLALLAARTLGGPGKLTSTQGGCLSHSGRRSGSIALG